MKNRALLYIGAAIGALIVFQVTYGTHMLNPTNVNWLMMVRQDWGTHYLGWFFYRNEPWTFPLGNISAYYYPLGTNVGFTDSIPLMAIFFKLFSPILPADFQYFGIWFLICDLLTAYFTVRLLQHFRIRPVYILLSVVFVVANPVLIYRGLHPALCAHWLLIGSLYVYFLDPKSIGPRRILAYQLILLLLSAAINPYLCFMVLGQSSALAVKLFYYDRATGKKGFFGYLAVSVAGMLLTWYLIGLIDFKKKEELGVGGAYGLYSLNLNSLYNPFGFSSFLPSLKQVSWHQYEGYMYLGLGSFLLLLILLVHFGYIRRKTLAGVQAGGPAGEAAGERARESAGQPAGPSRKGLRYNGTYLPPLLVLLILMTLFALTNIISINDKVLFKIPLPRFLTNLGDVFRASARFFWLPYYVIILFALIGVAKLKVRFPLGISLMLAALALQLYDIKSLLIARQWIPAAGTYHPPLNESWTPLMAAFDNVVFYPPFESHQLKQMDYQDFSWLAARQGKPINIGYVARSDGYSMKAYSDSLIAMLEDGQISPKTLYITTPRHLEEFDLPLQADSVQLHSVDGYFYLYAKGIRNPRLDTMNTRLDAENKGTLDSALQATTRKTEFSVTGKLSDGDKKPIHYYINRINKGIKDVSLEGWAFLDTSQNNKGDSIYITLSSADGSYIVPAGILPRPDLTEYFHRPYLGDGGFSTLAFFDSLPKGEYHLGIAIKDQQGRFIYQGDTTRIEVGTLPRRPQYK
jgi:hypothetical protein